MLHIPGVGGNTVMSSGIPVFIISGLTSSDRPSLRLVSPEGERLGEVERLGGEWGGVPLLSAWVEAGGWAQGEETWVAGVGLVPSLSWVCW